MGKITQRKVCSWYKGVYNLQQDVYGLDISSLEQLGTRPKGTTPDVCGS